MLVGNVGVEAAAGAKGGVAIFEGRQKPIRRGERGR